MKKEYCKYCGLELENGMCTCDEFLNSLKMKKKYSETLICDTCKKKIDEDAKFCPYCGMILSVNGNNIALQKELKGENAPDVLEYYSAKDLKEGKKVYKRESGIRILSIVMIVMAIFLYSFMTYIYPYIKKRVEDAKLKNELLNSETTEYLVESTLDTNLNIAESSYIEETKNERISLRDKWVNQDGFFYAYDKNGDPVVDDWVTETDENGVEQKYYFDIDGKLVVDSWIDGEYYVGSDGAMLKDTATPDGAYVDEDGRVLVQQLDAIPVEIETHVYYESPNSEAETVVASKQKSSNSGNIKGVDQNESYELYIKNIIQKRETVTKGNLRCNIIYYVPVIVGAKEKEVKNVNDAINNSFEEFKNLLVNEANSASELPKSIIFNTVEQRTVNSNRMNIIVHGKVSPRKGLTEKRKFRFVYDRKSKEVKMMDITE